MVRRRFQKGCFFKEKDGRWYSIFYLDGLNCTTKQVKKFIGDSREMSERAARRQHTLTMAEVNRLRGGSAPVLRGHTFQSAVDKWRAAVEPNLAPGTARQRESYLRAHILPRFVKSGLEEMDVHAVQQFATDLRKSLSHKSVVNILGSVFTILAYAEKCGMKVPKVGFTDLE